jgi:pyruvate, orthophosphate dikinase
MDIADLKKKILDLKETNPMVGHRGIRLLLTNPDILQLQTRAIFSAAKIAMERGIQTDLVIIVPMINSPAEITEVKKWIDDSFFSIFHASSDFNYRIGVMVETPRIAILSDQIQQDIQYISFGTNDLTAFTFSISRNDAYKKFFRFYLQQKIEKTDPFIHLDEAVKFLIELTIQKIRTKNKKIHIGICGEQANETENILYCKNLQFDSVTCSMDSMTKALLLAAQDQTAPKISLDEIFANKDYEKQLIEVL